MSLKKVDIKTKIIGVVAGSLLSAGAIFAGENLVKNSSFENGLDNWSFYTEFKNDITCGVDSDALTGTKAAFITVKDNFIDKHPSGFLSQLIPVTPGHVYSVSGYHKQKIAETGNAYIQINYLDANKKQIDNDYIKWPTDLSYTQEAINSIAPEGAAYIEVLASLVLKPLSSNTGHYDDIVVVEDDWYIANENVFPGSDFEGGNYNGWVVSSGTATIVSENPHGGSKELKLSGKMANMERRVTIEPGATYNIYGYSRVSAAAGGAMSWFQISYYDASGNKIRGWNTDFAETWANKTTYMLTSRELELPPSNAKEIGISCWNEAGGGTVSYFDDIRLVMLKKKDGVANLNRNINYSQMKILPNKFQNSSYMFLPNGKRVESNLLKAGTHGIYFLKGQKSLSIFENK